MNRQPEIDSQQPMCRINLSSAVQQSTLIPLFHTLRIISTGTRWLNALLIYNCHWKLKKNMLFSCPHMASSVEITPSRPPLRWARRSNGVCHISPFSPIFSPHENCIIAFMLALGLLLKLKIACILSLLRISGLYSRHLLYDGEYIWAILVDIVSWQFLVIFFYFSYFKFAQYWSIGNGIYYQKMIPNETSKLKSGLWPSSKYTTKPGSEETPSSDDDGQPQSKLMP